MNLNRAQNTVYFPTRYWANREVLVILVQTFSGRSSKFSWYLYCSNTVGCGSEGKVGNYPPHHMAGGIAVEAHVTTQQSCAHNDDYNVLLLSQSKQHFQEYPHITAS